MNRSRPSSVRSDRLFQMNLIYDVHSVSIGVLLKIHFDQFWPLLFQLKVQFALWETRRKRESRHFLLIISLHFSSSSMSRCQVPIWNSLLLCCCRTSPLSLQIIIYTPVFLIEATQCTCWFVYQPKNEIIGTRDLSHAGTHCLKSTCIITFMPSLCLLVDFLSLNFADQSRCLASWPYKWEVEQSRQRRGI